MRAAKASIVLAGIIAAAAAVHAGDGLSMKCQAPTCGYESQVIFGGGMNFQQMTGYCRQCKKFVYLNWTREDLSPEMAKRFGISKVTLRPNPLGEVWDAQTGQVITIHACPTCKGPFAEIKAPDALKHCPVCNNPHFGVDKSKPVMAID